MDNNQEIMEQAKKLWDTIDLIDLSHDIEEGFNLINKRNNTPIYIYNSYGFIENNTNYIQNENDIVNYINKIIKKYKIYIDVYNLGVEIRRQAFQGNNITNNIIMNDIDNYVNFLIILQNAKIVGKALDEIFK